MKKRVLSLFLAFTLCFSMLPTAALAEEAGVVQDAANANSTYTTGENAGLTGGKDGSVPDNTDGGDADSSGEAQDGEADTAVSAVQELIDALPDEVTAENAETVAEQLAAIDAALEALTAEQLTKVDLTRYETVCAALTELSAVQEDSHASHCVYGGNGDVNGHTHSTNTAWKAANSLPNSAGSYYLTQSVSGGWTVPEGEVNLCLNGQTIDGSIKVGSGATLTLTDCSGNGKVQGEVTVNGGKFELYSGTITGGVQVGINGGSYQTGSSFTMYGGAITGNEESSGSGGGVFLVGTTNETDPPSFTMHGGTISNNTAGASDGGGGGVYVGQKCSFTMDGGTITDNTATKGNGGGIYIHYNAGSVSISNATITDNKAPATRDTRYGHGGGIYSERGVTVKNVTITGNNSTYEGGGIYGKGAITLTDATVTDNSQYDVYYDGKETTTPELTVSGSVKAGYYANFDWKLPILVSGELSENSVIHVGVREGIEHGAIAEPASGVTLRAENFKADAADSETSLGKDGKVYLVPCTHEMDDTGYTCKKCKTQFDARVGDSAYYKTLTDAFNAARGSTVTLLRNVTLTGNCSSENYSATLDLNGKTVSTENKYIRVGGGNKSNTLTVKDSSKGGGTQALNVKFSVGSNGTLAVDDSYTGEISRVELQAGGALERFGGKIGELVLSNAAYGSTSTGYGLKLWKGNTNACTIGKITDNTKSKSLTVNDLLGTDYAKCELYGEKDDTWSIVPKTEKISELTGYTAYKVKFTECVHQCADDSNPVCSVCHKDLYTKITAKAADGTTKTAYFTEDSALENGYVEAIQTLNGWSNEGCTEPTLTLLRDMPYGTSITLTGTLTLESGTHTAKNVTVAENANVTFASGSYKGATIDGTATVEAGVTFTDASVTVNGTLNAKGGNFNGSVKFDGSSIANISGGSFNCEKKYGGVTFNYNVTGTISGGTFVFADFYTTKVKLSGGTFKEIKSYGDHKLADLLAEGAAYYGASDNQAVTNDRVNTLENVKVVSHTHNGGTDGKGICSACKKQMAASLTVGGKTSWYAAFATAIEAANAADGEKTITLYQNVDDTVYGKRTAYELTRGPVTLATGGKTVKGVDLIAKGISLTVTGSNGSFYVTVDGKDAKLTVNDKNTELAIVTAQNGGKLSLSNGTFSRVAVKDDGSSASLSGGSYGAITSDAGYVKPYALLAKGYAYKKTTDNKWLPNANSIPSKVTVEKAPFAVEKIYPNSDTNYTGNSAFATDGNITLTAVIAPETEDVTYYYWWELFNESENDWTTTFSNVNTATHDGKQSKTLTISGLPVDKSYQYHIFVQCSNGYQCYSEPFTVTCHEHSWTYTANGATITAKCTAEGCYLTDGNGGSVTINKPAHTTYGDGQSEKATLTENSWQGLVVNEDTITYTKGDESPTAAPTDAGTYTASITLGSATASVTYTIGKATPKAEDFTFTAPTSLTYDGNVKSATVSPAKAGTGDVIVKYYDKDGKEATPKNAGEYTVKIDVAESTNYAAANGLTADGWKFTITKAAAPTAAPGSLTITNGLHKTYSLDFSALLPKLTAPCDYGTITYGKPNTDLGVGGYKTFVDSRSGKLTLEVVERNSDVEGQFGTITVTISTGNYQDITLTVNIFAKNKITPVLDGEVTASEITYGQTLSDSSITGKMKDPTTGKSVNGTFAWKDGTINPNAGDYEAEWTFTPAAGYEKYATATGTVTIKVNKATPTFTAPTAQENLTYTGQEQALITAGSVMDYGTMQYSLTENGTYSQDIPAGTDAGAYTVWYRVIGDANHNDTAPASVAVRIGQKPLTITGVTAASKPYDGTTDAGIASVTFDGVNLNRGTDYTVTANFDDASVDSGKNITATVTLMEQAAQNYALEQSSFPTTGSIIKAAAPDFTKETALTIVNGHEKTYTVTLPALPTLETPKAYGALTYEIGEIKLNDGYYTSGAKVENGELTLPIQKNDVETTGSVGTVTVVIKSANYEDITLTVNVSAKNKLSPVLAGTLTLTPIKITYGEPLSKIKITGTMKAGDTVVEGTFTWQNPDTVLKASTTGRDAEWKFTPTDKAVYTETTGTAFVKVDKAMQSGTVSMADYTYGETPSTPSLTDRTGDGSVTYYYTTTDSNSGGIKWENIQADTLNAGTYYMYAELGETENYGSFTTACVKFRVVRAMPTYTAPTGLTAKYGQTLEDVTLPDGWSWMDSKESVGDASAAAKTFQAKFIPTDTENYNMVENIELEVTVNKADGGNLKTVELEQKYTDASDHTYTPDWARLPAGQDWTFSSEASIVLPKQDFAADGNLLTYAISGGKVGDKITITLKASCDNYEDFTITLNVTLTEKDDQKSLTITGGTTVVYGQTLQLGTSGGNGNGAVTYAVTNGTGEATIDATGKLTPVKVGKVKVSATKAGDASYNSIISAEVEITITRATPTGEPAYTKITASGKTLADAALGIGTITPAGGTIAWDDPTTTEVVANKSYGWTYTPTDTNYTIRTGTIKLWSKSSGGGSYYAPVVPDMPMLYRGCTGDAVKTLQEKLNAKGFDSGNVDGIFGAKTYAAATAFQKANGLGVDGIVGKLTWGKLYGVSPAMPVETTTVVGRPMVSYGSRGDAVRKLQELLNALGYDCGSVDGIFGSKTKAAVLAFQKANGLGADGIVGPLTWGKLV